MQEIHKQPISILVVDDHQMFIDGIKSLLRKEGAIQILGEAENGCKALEFLKNQEVDIVVTDINMPEMNGTELTKAIKSEFPAVKVLVLTMFNDREIIHEIINAEAEGYILKNTGRDELVTALYKIADNGSFYSNEVADIMIADINKRQAIEENTKQLTPRETEILKLIVKEYSSAQIAGELYISPRTVDTHRKHIMQKTGSKTIVGLIKFALENDIT